MVINTTLLLLVILILAALWTALATRVLHSAIGLAVTSAVLSIILFRFDSPIAAVLELSVCAGLIFALFIGTISVTQRFTAMEIVAQRKERLHKYWLLPILVIIVAGALSFVDFNLAFPLPAQPQENSVKKILWGLRHLDLFGQIVILLAGAFGVAVLFKGWKNDR
jgi:NADH-quinone oxidoreductase subunit J